MPTDPSPVDPRESRPAEPTGGRQALLDALTAERFARPTPPVPGPPEPGWRALRLLRDELALFDAEQARRLWEVS